MDFSSSSDIRSALYIISSTGIPVNNVKLKISFIGHLFHVSDIVSLFSTSSGVSGKSDSCGGAAVASGDGEFISSSSVWF
jgi:hypothetical protein